MLKRGRCTITPSKAPQFLPPPVPNPLFSDVHARIASIPSPLLLFFFSTQFLQKTLELLLLFGHFALSSQSKCSPSKMHSSLNTDAPLKLIKFSTTKFSLPFKCSSWRIDRASNCGENSTSNSQAPLVLFDRNHEATKSCFFIKIIIVEKIKLYIYIFIFICIKNNYGNFATWRQKRGSCSLRLVQRMFLARNPPNSRGGKKKVEIAIFTR